MVIQCCVSCCFGKQQRQVRIQDMPRHLSPEPVMRAATLLEEVHIQRYVAEQLGVSQPVIWKCGSDVESYTLCKAGMGQEEKGKQRKLRTDPVPSKPTQYG